VTEDNPEPPVTAEQIASELEYFTNRDRWPEPDALIKRDTLLSFLRKLLGPKASADRAVEYRDAELLARALQDLLTAARKRALEGGSRNDRDYVQACKVAAAGELLGIADSDGHFEQRLVLLKRRKDDYQKQYDKAKERPGTKEPRQVRATVWLDGVDDDNNKFSPNYAFDRQKEIIFILGHHLIGYIIKNTQPLTSQLMNDRANPPAQQATSEPRPDTPSPAATQQHTPLQPTYIHRPELEAQFGALVDAGAKLIALVGQPGMGKTWLAEELTRDPVTGAPAPIIDLSNPSNSARDLMAAFSRTSSQPPPIPDPVVQLANLACSETAPPFIVLDNLDSADELKDLLPRHTRSIIVVTCRSKGESASYRVIDIDMMERAETIEMISRHLPDLDADDMEHLASTFADHPLVISHVCRLFPNQEAPLRRFCDELARDARHLAARVQTEDQSMLLAILRRTVRLVRQRDVPAYEMLVFMSFMWDHIWRPLLWRYFEKRYSSSLKGASASLRFAHAVSVLKAFSLIQVESWSEGFFCVMHPFTQEVLRLEFDSRQDQVVAHICMLEWEIGEEVESSRDEALGIAYIMHSATALTNWLNQRHPDWASWSDEKRTNILDALVLRYGRRVLCSGASPSRATSDKLRIVFLSPQPRLPTRQIIINPLPNRRVHRQPRHLIQGNEPHIR
jgi:hypothetical protein